jgi:predicted ATP-binding protein involved in virulence
MRIVEIEIEQLFGTFNHRIRLNTEDRVTIIHGPNGFGKTVLLEMVHGLFNRRYEKLEGVPFDQLVVVFEDGTRAVVRKQMVEMVVGRQTDGRLNRDDFLAPYRIVLQVGKGRQRQEAPLYPPTEGDPKWWQEFRNSVRVEMIREQRRTISSLAFGLGQSVPGLITSAAEERSDELARTLQKKLAESVELSQSLDRTFPARLLKRIHEDGLSESELTERLAELERKRGRLQIAGLLDEQEEMPLLPIEHLAEETRDVLAIYVEDAEKKLSVFDDLSRRIELFQEIINSRFLFKRLSISRSKGLVFTTSAGNPLPLNALSSGEQQEVILLYELLFRLKPNSLVLIDEPEISLHVAWQKKFLEDLTKITELASFDVLIATHSPQIIHKRWDLTVELESPKTEAELEAVSLP